MWDWHGDWYVGLACGASIWVWYMCMGLGYETGMWDWHVRLVWYVGLACDTQGSTSASTSDTNQFLIPVPSVGPYRPIMLLFTCAWQYFAV